SKTDAEVLADRLKRMEVLVVPSLQASYSLNNVHHTLERRWHVDGNIIYLHEDHVNEAELALALANALDVRSEADFYENLLRCNNDGKRREKLLSKNIPDAEIDRWLRKYAGKSATKEEEEVRVQSKEDDKHRASPPPARETIRELPENTKQAGSPPEASSDGDTPQRFTAESSSDGWSGSAKTQPEPPSADKPRLHLKDVQNAAYVIDCAPEKYEQLAAGSGGGYGGGMPSVGRYLTEPERAALDEAGRTIAARALEERGFSVEIMSPENPGFDLRAKKNGEEWRIEVKAHEGRKTVVDLTMREYDEYMKQGKYRWELWNVENLAENDARIVITPYNTIPIDALDIRTFRVDLKKCQNKIQNSADGPITAQME
ncbi:MAG: DUF3883 domain-containing protein, partial [Candidatus Sumerlaeia bacterium]|nr:DUF3883 domain-containing protein [Candidatus Sumerlaeia bacterium]